MIRGFALADRVYSTRGGFVTAPVLDASGGLDLDPGLLERLDPLFRIALYVARIAWADSRNDRVDRGRVGIVFGNIVLPTETASDLTRELLGRSFDEQQLGASANAGESTRFEPLNAFPAGLPAAIVARALGLGGLRIYN